MKIETNDLLSVAGGGTQKPGREDKGFANMLRAKSKTKTKIKTDVDTDADNAPPEKRQEAQVVAALLDLPAVILARSLAAPTQAAEPQDDEPSPVANASDPAPQTRAKTPSGPNPPQAATGPRRDGAAGETPAATPLEQVAQHLLTQRPARSAQTVRDDESAESASPNVAIDHGTSTAAAVADATDAPPQVAAVAARVVADLTPQSHAHVVIDDGQERVVVTVAVRGNDVNVTLRASDDQTAAALARNAASLDDAMRGRGLVLGELQTRRSPSKQGRDLAKTRRQRNDQEPYELEEDA